MIQSIGRPYNVNPGHAYQGSLFRPRCRVSFHTAEALFSFESGFPDPTSELLSVKTQKSLTQPVGTITITLAPRQVGTDYDQGKQDWFHRINPMDLVVVDMKQDLSYPWKTVMVGFVDQVRINFTGGDRPTRIITIIASDFGKILTRCNADFYATVDDVQGLQRFIKTPGKTPLYQEADTSSPVIGELAPNSEHEMLAQVGNFYYVEAQRFGYGYVSASSVSLIKKESASSSVAAAKLTQLMQDLSGSVQAGDVSVTGLLWDIFFTGAIDDPAKAQATLFTKWLYKVFNVSSVVYTKNGPIQADLPSLLRFILTKPPSYGNPSWMSGAGSAYTGSIWTLLQSMACLPLCEVWVDTRTDVNWPLIPANKVAYSSQMYDGQLGATIPGGVTFGQENDAQVVYVFRETPFDEDNWNRLVIHKINNKLIREMDIGKTDLDVLNCYWVTPINATYTQNQLISSIPAWLDGISAVKYGLQSLRVSLNASSIDSPEAIAKKLWTWFKDNPQFLNGTITFKGIPTVRIGQRLYNESDGYSYYIDEVTQTWENYQEYYTTVTVSRGMVRGD